MNEIMQQIRNELEKQHISQRNFAKDLGVGEVTVNRWMNGHRVPSLDNLEKMARRLGMEVSLHTRNPHWVRQHDEVFEWMVCSECGYGADGEVFPGMETPFCPMCGTALHRKGGAG